MNKYLIYTICATALFISSCGSTQPIAKDGNNRVLGLSEDARLKLDRLYIEATKAKMLGEYQKASSLYSECIKLDPDNHAAMYELAKIYLETGQTQPGLLFSKKATELDPSNKWYQVLYGEALAISGNYKDAAKVYEKLVNDDWGSFLKGAAKLNIG